MIDKTYEEFARAFATRVIESDFAAAHRMLAPWLAATIAPEQIQEMIKKEVEAVKEANELEGELHPTSYQIDYNSCTLQDLKEMRSYREARKISEEINDRNFRQWMVVQFQPTEQEQDDLGIDAYLDWWMMLVHVGGEIKIGYFEIEDPD
jgi:hypothetical protein